MNMIEGVRLPANVVVLARNMIDHLVRVRTERDAYIMYGQLVGLARTMASQQRISHACEERLGFYFESLVRARLEALRAPESSAHA